VDPTALAPERLLVFEVRDSVGNFATAIRRVPGLELIDEEELGADEDKTPVAYLLLPDIRALNELISFWRRWLNGTLARGETPWRGVFETLRDLRAWGPQDRVQPVDAHHLANEIDGRSDEELVTIEVELIYRASDEQATSQEEAVRTAISANGGIIISQARLPDIAYHALLVDLPTPAIRRIVERDAGSIAELDPVMHIRAQSTVTSIEIEDVSAAGRPVPVRTLGEPILALLDGVPIEAHPLLGSHLIIDDQFELVPDATVADRVHGTAMASLIIHGDRNNPALSLPRHIHVVPVMGAHDVFPPRRLVIDIIYLAVLAMREGPNPTAPGVIIVNLSLGNSRRPFARQMSPWARLLDRLAYKFGILFMVSAGNIREPFEMPAFATHTAFDDADAAARITGTLAAIGNIIADRRLISPSETINGVTVGASNDDWVPGVDRGLARINIDPFPGIRAANPSSALGPGFAQAVKPDIIMPGGREHLQLVHSEAHIFVRPAQAGRPGGLKVAAPPRGGIEGGEAFTGGTSAATALGSRTCHRIHDALEAAYPTFLELTHIQRAVLLKALIVHPARWPAQAAAHIRATIGPLDARQHVRIKDNIRRFFGFGYVDEDDAVACAEDRATFWAVGTLGSEQNVRIRVPIPAVMGGQARPHSLSATLAWFTPVSPARKSYRSVRLKILQPESLSALSIAAAGEQPDANQTNRGTVYTRRWEGNDAPAVSADMTIDLVVQREPDPGPRVDDAVPFGLAVTLAMPGVVGVYEQVAQRIQPRPRV